MEFDTATTPREIKKFTIQSGSVSTCYLEGFWWIHWTIRVSDKAQYPEPLKHATEACITKWTATTKKEPANTDIELIKNTWIIKI